MSNTQMILADDGAAMPLKDSEVNHLRLVLAWMRCQWMLDEDMQRGYLKGAAWCVESEIASPEKAGEIVTEAAAKVNQVPAYVRHGVKMLTKALRKYEQQAKIVEVTK